MAFPCPPTRTLLERHGSARCVCHPYRHWDAPRCCGGWEHADRHRDSRHCVQVCTRDVVNSDTDAVCPVASSIVKKMFPSLRLILSNEITALFLFIIPFFMPPPFPVSRPLSPFLCWPLLFSFCSFNLLSLCFFPKIHSLFFILWNLCLKSK